MHVKLAPVVAVVGVVLLAAVGCSPSSPAPSVSSSAVERDSSVEWIVGGGADPTGTKASSIDLITPSRLPGLSDLAVGSDGAVWTGACAGGDECRGLHGRADRLLRVDASGKVLWVEVGEIRSSSDQDSMVPVIVSGPVTDGGTGVYIVVSTSLGDSEDESSGNQSRTWFSTVHVSADGVMEAWRPALPEGFTVTRLGYSATDEVLVVGTHRVDEGFNMSQLFAVDSTTLEARNLFGREPQYVFESGESFYLEPEETATATNYPLTFSHDPAARFLLLSDGRIGVLRGGVLSGPNDTGVVSRLLGGEASIPIDQDGTMLAGEWVDAAPLISSHLGDVRPLPDGGMLAQIQVRPALDSGAGVVPRVDGAPSDSDAQSILDDALARRMSESTANTAQSAVYATVEFDAAAIAGDSSGRARVLSVSGAQATCAQDFAGNTACKSVNDARIGTDTRAVVYRPEHVQ